MCISSEAGSYLRLIDFLRHSTLGLRVLKKKNPKLLRAEDHLGGFGEDLGGSRGWGDKGLGITE